MVFNQEIPRNKWGLKAANIWVKQLSFLKQVAQTGGIKLQMKVGKRGVVECVFLNFARCWLETTRNGGWMIIFV